MVVVEVSEVVAVEEVEEAEATCKPNSIFIAI